MFRFAVIAVLIVAASAQYARPGYGGGLSHGGRLGYGHGAGYADDLAEPTPYNFGYDIKDDYNGGSSRQESGDGYGNVKGSYGYTDGNGIYRQVEYTADDYGYKASIKSNEPGTDNQNPADVSIYTDPIQVKTYAPKRGYGASAHKVVAHAPSYGSVGYATAPYGHGSRYGSTGSRGYGHGNTGYGYANRARSYGIPSYGLSAPSYGTHGLGSYGRSLSYKKPTYA